MATKVDSDRFADAVFAALRNEINRVADEEIEAAHKRIAERVHKQLGSIATAIFARYDMSMQREEILIRVRNETLDRRP